MMTQAFWALALLTWVVLKLRWSMRIGKYYRLNN
jgi:hypothetical protein